MTATQPEGLDMTDKKTLMRGGFEAQRKAGMNVDWFTWQIAWHDALFQVHDIAGDALLSASKPAATPGWRTHPRLANIPHHSDPNMRVIGFVVPVSEKWPLGCVAEQLAEIIEPAAPAQSGEPVAWMLEVPSESTRWYTSVKQAKDHWVSKGAVATPLYTTPQPSPTAVVLDERADAWRDEFNERHEFDVYPEHFMSGLRNEFAAGWHAALKSEARAAFPQPATQNPMLDKAERDISATQVAAQPVEQADFPYQRTFNAIAAATYMSSNNAISISVRAFQEAYNAVAQPVEHWTKEQVAAVREDAKRLHAKLTPGKLADDAQPVEQTRALTMDEGELDEFDRTVSDFEDDGETSTDYNLLMDWAQRGFLECTHFEVTKAGQDLLTAARPASGETET